MNEVRECNLSYLELDVFLVKVFYKAWAVYLENVLFLNLYFTLLAKNHYKIIQSKRNNLYKKLTFAKSKQNNKL